MGITMTEQPHPHASIIKIWADDTSVGILGRCHEGFCWLPVDISVVMKDSCGDFEFKIEGIKNETK
jgi:hypothetical protein